MPREYFCAYHSYIESMEQLTDAERGRLFTACLFYSKTGEAPQLSGNERFVFPAMRSQIDRDIQNYEDFVKKQSENGKKGGRPRKPTESQKTQPFFEKPKEGKEKEKEKEKEISPLNPPRGKRERFTPPTVEDVAAYCLERENSIDPEEFVSFYASKGWKVGSSPMKDWRAAVITWEKKRAKETSPEPESAKRGRLVVDENGEEVAVFDG